MILNTRCMSLPKQIKISQIIDETPFVKTFYFDHKLNSKPGQFVMLWIPEIDQKPFSIAYDDGQRFGLTVFKRGPLTEKLFSLQINDRVGITGPFGTNFSIQPDTRYIMVAGGYGAAPLGFLAEEIYASNSNSTADFLMGARDKENLLFEERLSKIPNVKIHISTDDGSKGYKGYVTDILNKILKKELDPSTSVADASFARDDNQSILVVTCGPELMEKKILDTCNKYNIDCEVSIERYMKCGFGICGQCVVDPIGICMCKQGPVVNRKLANKIIEFGKYHRDKSGRKVNL